MYVIQRVLARSLVPLAAVVLTAAIAACSAGSSASSGSSASGLSGSSLGPSGKASCIPAAPNKLPTDPDGVAASLTGAAKAAMWGYPGTVYESPWIHFKPKHPGP